MGMLSVALGLLLLVIEISAQCRPNPCQNGATCSPTRYPPYYRCHCPPCYEGTNCQIMKRLPPVCPCLNRGTCACYFNGVKEIYRCTCPTNYYGLRCEQHGPVFPGPPDPCLSYPCPRRCTCRTHPRNTGYTCYQSGYPYGICPTGPPDPCLSNPCTPRCTCRTHPGNTGYTCYQSAYPYGICPTGPPDPCLSNPCTPRCTCRTHPGNTGYTCYQSAYPYSICPTGWGLPCARTPAMCQNGGTCHPAAGNGFTCECACFVTGIYCEHTPAQLLINKCQSSPCQHGGTCKCVGFGYKCLCAPGYSGENCQYGSSRVCVPSPCRNGGTCVPLSATAYKCTCPCWVIGRHCEFPPTTIPQYSPCQSSPCMHGGTCHCHGRGWDCTCVPPYRGLQCQY